MPQWLSILRLGAHLLWGALTILAAYPFCNDNRRLALKQGWSRRLLELIGIRLDAALGGVAPGSLIVANHISWVDIFVLNAARPVAFVSKSEVRDWPLVGWLAARTDTVFLRRGSRGHARIVNAEIDALLNAGKDVAVFPEGTTTDSTHLLGFHGALLQPAIETGRPVQPIALSYRSPTGQRSLSPAYVGETTLLQSLRTILREPGIIARLEALPPIAPEGKNRRQIAHTARSAIALSLGLPLVNNPPETPAGPPTSPPSDARPTGTPNPAPTDSAAA